jgi:hypothetical protein
LRIIEHVSKPTHWICSIGTGFSLDGSSDSLQTLLSLGIGRIEFQGFFKGIFGANQITQPVLGGALSTPALRPVRLDLCRLVCVVQSCLVVFERSVCAGSVGVEDVVRGV